MRICLLTGGGYPYRRDALGGWCRTLVAGLTGHAFHLVTLTDREPLSTPAYPVPANVVSAQVVSYAGPRRRRLRVPPGVVPFAGRPAQPPGERDDAAAAAVLLCRGLLDDAEHGAETFAHGLRRLSVIAGSDDAPLTGVPLADALLDAWRTGRESPAVDRMPLPRLSVRDARTAATLLRHVTGALTVRPPDADLLHCVGGTTPLLAALAGRWRTGTPLLLTEARAPTARHRWTDERLSPVVRTILRRFRRAVARTGYAEADLIAPLSAYHHGWALRHGAQPARLVAVPAGVDPREYPTAPDDPAPDGASLVWTGGGDPDSGLGDLLDAFAVVVAARPGTVLHLTGITDAHRNACTARVSAAGLTAATRLHAPAGEMTAGQVVVHRAGPGEPPYRLIEAMMSGRPVVAADIGPVAETLGDAGVLVPADDPAALATACVDLLRDPARRRDLGDAARRRALAHFTADRVVRAYDALYTDLAGPPPAPVYELALAVPAPRGGRSGTDHRPPTRPDPHHPPARPDPGHPWSAPRGLAQEER